MLWPEIRPWCDWTIDGWIPGGTGLGAGRAGSLVLSVEKDWYIRI